MFLSPCQNPMILESTADKVQVRGKLKKLLDQMEELQKRAFLYKSYQKNFKVSPGGHFFFFKNNTIIQLSVVITQSNIKWYCMHHCRNWGKKKINQRLKSRKTSHTSPWRVFHDYFGENWSRYNGTALYFTHILLGYFNGPGAVIWLLHYLWTNHEEYG